MTDPENVNVFQYIQVPKRATPSLTRPGALFVCRNFDKARTYYEQALEIKGKALSTTHPEYANTQFHLGEVSLCPNTC
jgi:hypothetical protein